MDSANTIRLGFEEIKVSLIKVLLHIGFSEDRADHCATLFTESSLDGVYSHGLNRFPLFIQYIRKGMVAPNATPSLNQSLNNFENWDGNSGPGNLNAWFCMDRAIKLAKEHGTGMVSIRNTNHWMRGGSYGIQAAKENCIGICFTNTKPNMPPWGGQEPKVGNNPFIVAVPDTPYPVLLDMAMSQFSYGKFEIMKQQGKDLSQPGGFDKDLNQTTNPAEIIETELALPMGYWKGSGMSMMLDLIVSLLSGGLNTTEIGRLGDERLLSQFFMAFDLDQLTDTERRKETIQTILSSVTDCKPMESGQQVYYPGQQTWKRREENEKEGIPVNKDTWDKIQKML